MEEQIKILKQQIRELEEAKASGLYFANISEAAAAAKLSAGYINNNKNMPKPRQIGNARIYLKKDFAKWIEK
jgi:hypothetical protein